MQEQHTSWLALRQTTSLVDVEVENALSQNCDLRLDAYIALSWLYQRDAQRAAVSPRGLEKAVNLTPSGTSRLLARMEDDAVIVRSVSVADRRAIEVSLTASGVQRLKRAQPYVADAVARVLNERAIGVMAASALAVSTGRLDEGAVDPGERDESLSISGILTWHTVDAVSAADALVVRQAIEPAVLVEAARYATEAAVVDLTRAVVDMVRSTHDPEAFFAADSRFHARIASLCQNRMLREIYVHVVEQLESGLYSVDGDDATTEPYLANRAKVHADLVDAITRHDMAAVRAAAGRHQLVRVVDESVDPIKARDRE